MEPAKLSHPSGGGFYPLWWYAVASGEPAKRCLVPIDGSAPTPKLRLVPPPQLTPRLPQPQEDDAVSPKEVGHTVCEEQVEEAEKCMRSCREMIVKLEDLLEASPEDTQVRIRKNLVELTTKIRDCARV